MDEKLLSRYRWIILTFLLVAIYWSIESLLDAFLFFDDRLLMEIFYPSSHELWMRSLIIVVIIGFGIYVQYTINKLKSSEKEIEDLYSLLLSIRNVNQLIVQESDLEKLLQKTAEMLLDTRGYIDTTVAILKDDKIKPVAHFGEHEKKEWSVSLEDEGNTPKCIKDILENKEIKIIYSTAEYCKRCEFCDHKTDHKTIVMPFTREDKVVGALITCLSRDRKIKDEEIDLIKEISNDLAFAREKILAERKRKESERKKQFLNTTLKQDLLSKTQISTGSLQLLEDEEKLSEEGRKHLEKALISNLEAIDIVEEVKELEEINKVEQVGNTEIVKMIEKAIQESQELKERKNVEIDFDFDSEKLKVKGDYSLKHIFKNLIYARIENDSESIHISIEEKDDHVSVKFEDDGKEVPPPLKESFPKSHYTGEWTGIKGFRYYLVGELINQNDASIEVDDSELGGASFELTFEKIK